MGVYITGMYAYILYVCMFRKMLHWTVTVQVFMFIPMYICMYLGYARMQTSTYTYMHVYIFGSDVQGTIELVHSFRQTETHTDTHTYKYIHTFMHTIGICVVGRPQDARRHIHTYIYRNLRYMEASRRARAHTHTHTYIHRNFRYMEASRRARTHLHAYLHTYILT